MKTQSLLCFWLAVLLAGVSLTPAQAQNSNIPPEVSIVWPRTDCSPGYNQLFNVDTVLKIKASALDPDGSIAQVQFFADSTLIGAVTNAPFSVIWKVTGPSASHPVLKAVAMDNLGATNESLPIQLTILGGFAMPPVFEIIPITV